MAQAVSPGGKIYAVELDQGFLDHINMRAKERNVTNVVTVLGKPVDPNLPAKDVDLAFIHDVLHHVADRAGYLKGMAPYIKPDGRVAIIELSAEKGSHRDEPELVVTKPQVDGWMADVGFKPVERIEGLPEDKWFTIYARQ
jgi:ubiquinone/menaquinone biosynthesis C-methylase UbiE